MAMYSEASVFLILSCQRTLLGFLDLLPTELNMICCAINVTASDFSDPRVDLSTANTLFKNDFNAVGVDLASYDAKKDTVNLIHVEIILLEHLDCVADDGDSS